MAGNHRRLHANHDQWMLAIFAIVVGWVTLEAWQPEAPVIEAPTPRPTQLASLARLIENDPVPTYVWLQESPATSSPAPTQDVPTLLKLIQEESPEVAFWNPAANMPVDLPEVQVDLSELPLEEVAQSPLVGKPSIEIDTPEAKWLRDQIKRAQFSNTGWQMLPVGDWWYSPRLPMALFQYGRSTRSPNQLADTRTFASPPTLLTRPLVTSSSDRLAMRIAPPTSTISLPTDLRAWDERVVDAARPWMLVRLDDSLGEGYLAQPNALIELLTELACEPYARDWALSALLQVNDTVSNSTRTVVPNQQQLERLAYLTYQAEQLAEEAPSTGLATQLRRARYALWRRVEVWRAVSQVLAPPMEQVALASSTDEGYSHTQAIGTREQVPLDKLLAEIEAYESSPTAIKGEQLNYRIAQLFEAPSLSRQELGTTLSDHYSNANARIALTDDFLNRFIPKGEPTVEPVHDRILGTPVSGRATTESAAKVTLLPDPNAWRLGVEVTGHADSSTIAFERTVRVRTTGTTTFAARQQVLINPEGLFTGPVSADADSDSHFVNARSEYDVLPLVGDIVRSKAASTFSKRRNRAQQEVSQKAEERIRNQVDTTVRDALARAGGEWQSRIMGPLASGGVSIEPVEMRTTDERLIARARVLHGDALAAYTPRPRAPADSLASIQVHESALTNLVAGLNLAGQRMTAEQFVGRLREFAPGLPTDALDEDARDTVIEFAEGTPVTFELTEGKLHIAWEVKELVVRGRANRDFKVHVYYTPSADGLVATFNHQSGPYLEGQIRNAQRMRLQTIFGKMFPNEGYLELGTEYADDPRLEGLMITQLIIDDGWLGLAIGPAESNRTAQLDRYAPLWR